MGKYTKQASSYNMGMGMFSGGLKTVSQTITKIGEIISEEDSKDAMNYYVTTFNNELKGSIESLNAISVSLPVLVMQKAGEIDRRIEQERLLRERQQEEANVNK